MEETEGVTLPQAIQHWYGILEPKVKELERARVLSLPLTQTTTLEFVFITTDAIAVNLARERATMTTWQTKQTIGELKAQ